VRARVVGVGAVASTPGRGGGLLRSGLEVAPDVRGRELEWGAGAGWGWIGDREGRPTCRPSRGKMGVLERRRSHASI
jgi:hypothetical protein